MHVVEVVRHDQRHARPRRDLSQPLSHRLLLRKPVVVQLEEEVALAKDRLVLAGSRDGALDVVLAKRDGDLALEASGETDQPRGVLPQEVFVDAGPRPVPLEVRERDHVHQVAVALEVLG